MSMTLEERVQDLVAALNGQTFNAEDGNEGYLRKITPLIRSSLRKAMRAARAGERNACAKVIEVGQETTTNSDVTTYRLTPRLPGNIAGLAFAAAIRARDEEEA